LKNLFNINAKYYNLYYIIWQKTAYFASKAAFWAVFGFTLLFFGGKLVLRAEQEKINMKGGICGWSFWFSELPIRGKLCLRKKFLKNISFPIFQ
jgi:hypothetical protein